MNWNIVFDLHSPYVHRRKEIVPALIGAAAGIGTTLMNQFQTDKTNQQLYRMFSQQMRENSIEATRQRDWEEKMWNANNAYNTPAAQMKRYQEAGLNPFLVGQDYLASGQSTMPSSGAHASNSGLPVMHVPDNSPMLSVGQHLQDIVRLALQKRQIDASSADNTARAEREIIDNALKIRKQFGERSAREYYETRMKELRGASIESSEEWNNYLKQNEEQRYRTEIARVESSIASKYGEQRAETEIAKMNDEMMQIHAQIGLWSSLARLNDSNVSLNKAYENRVESEIVRNVAESTKAFAESSYVKSLKLTNDELRQYVVAATMFEAANRGLLFGENEANYAEGEDRRKYQHSDAAKGREAWSYSYGKGYVYQTASKTLDLVQKGVGSVIPLRHSSAVPKTPWQADYVKHNATRPTYSGKEEIEWYVPYNP